MIREIFLYGDQVLRRKAEEITGITPEIEGLAGDMLETMYRHRGLGLAGPQVGVSKRIVVIDVPQEGSGRLVLVNPVIREVEGMVTLEEGCLSFPDITAPVERGAGVAVEYTTLGGKLRTKMVSGVTAEAVQHELDHLDGVLFVDRISTARRALLSGKLRRLRRRGEKGERR